jgi:acetyl-CoA carboxylase biotin carboxylase subunit
MFRRILIANRGEIALRILRTAREMGVECVAIYSDWDAAALHVRMADQAIALGGEHPSESYLRADKVLEAAQRSGAEAIHPGYGFLSESAEFAQAVTDAGLAWIGPKPYAIQAMGDKISSRKVMQEAGVLLVPGTVEPAADPESAAAAAEEIGYPVVLKAAAGGGGKGIRIVRSPGEIESAFRMASGEADSAFGDGRLYLERYLDSPRHIEAQVLFDHHGNGVHFGVRECSIQRRHQKLVEECPSVVATGEMLEHVGQMALRAARAVDYVNAGTVEFLYDGSAAARERGEDQFYFLEMNTRLQVEHPITELVTGVDLVQEQLRVAAGEELGYEQQDVRYRGWAIEVRLNAEDPVNGFVPSTGTVKNLCLPGGPGVRIDSSLYNGLEVGLSYDPMLAKLVVWGQDRPTAIARMRRALQELNVGGVHTSAPAAIRVLEDARFREGEYDTHFLEGLDLAQGRGSEAELAAAIATIHRHRLAQRRALGPASGDRTGWLARGRASSSAYELRPGPNGKGGA